MVFQCARAVFDRTEITEFLPGFVAPTLAIAGSEDPSAPPAELKLMAGRIPSARLVVIEQGNHLVVAEKPREVAGAIRSFLEGLVLHGNQKESAAHRKRIDMAYSESMTITIPSQTIPEIRYKVPQNEAGGLCFPSWLVATKQQHQRRRWQIERVRFSR